MLGIKKLSNEHSRGCSWRRRCLPASGRTPLRDKNHHPYRQNRHFLAFRLAFQLEQWLVHRQRPNDAPVEEVPEALRLVVLAEEVPRGSGVGVAVGNQLQPHPPPFRGAPYEGQQVVPGPVGGEELPREGAKALVVHRHVQDRRRGRVFPCRYSVEHLLKSLVLKFWLSKFRTNERIPAKSGKIYFFNLNFKLEAHDNFPPKMQKNNTFVLPEEKLCKLRKAFVAKEKHFSTSLLYRGKVDFVSSSLIRQTIGVRFPPCNNSISVKSATGRKVIECITSFIVCFSYYTWVL